MEKEGLVGEKRIHPWVPETFRSTESLDSDEIAKVGNAALRDVLGSCFENGSGWREVSSLSTKLRTHLSIPHRRFSVF